MSKRFLAEVELLAGNPVGALGATPKQYVDVRSAPTGGAVGQVLTKTGAADHAMSWANAPAPGGIVDVSALTTVSQINAASASAAPGSIIWTGARRSAPIQIDTTWILRPYQKVMGDGGRNQLTRAVVTAEFPAGQPLMAAQGHLQNASAADSPIAVEGIFLDAGGKVGSDGLVIFNFWSHVQDVQVANCAGSTARGIRATDRGINGSTVSSNSHSENTFVRCRFYDFTAQATGFAAESYNGLSNQDGHLQDCFFASMGGYAILIGRAAGWTIENNHLYGIGYDGINLSKVYATKVINNYVEDFGRANGANNGAAPTYGYFNGICLGEVLDTRGSIMAYNTVSTDQPASPAGMQYTCFYARAGSGQNLANLAVVGNVATWASGGAPTTSRSRAFRFGEDGDSGRMLTVEWAGNLIQPVAWWQSTRSAAANTVTINDARVPLSHAASHGPGGSDDLSDAYLALTGTQTVAGQKTASGSWIFNAPPQVAQGTLLNHAARRDDPKFVPSGGAAGQLLGKASATDHDLTWITPGAGGVPATRQIASGAGLTGGGDLSADRTLAVAYGTTAGTAAQGNDSRITGAVQTGDARVTADQAAGTASIRTLGAGAQQAAAGNHSHTPSSIGAADSVHTHTGPQIMVSSRTVAYADLPTIAPLAGVALDVVYSVLTGNPTIAPAAGTDGQILRIRMLASGAQRTPAVSTAVRTGTGIADRAMAIPSGQIGVFGLEYMGPLSLWVLFSEYVVSAS